MAFGSVSFHFLSSRMPTAFAPFSLSSSLSSSFSSSSFSSAAPAAALEIRAARSAPPMPPLNTREPFLSKLASAAAPDPLALASSGNHDPPPYLDLFASPTPMLVQSL